MEILDNDTVTLSNVNKIYPSADVLCNVRNNVPCTETGCKSIFKSESNLALHLHQTHEKRSIKSENNGTSQYHCPKKNCTYNDERSFPKLKALKQHYVKVHAKKTYVCMKCEKGFATQAIQKSHTDYCGVRFSCVDCQQSYDCYETLTTHARRKKHKIDKKSHYATFVSERTPDIPIAPRCATVIFVWPETVDKHCQTDTKRKVTKRQLTQQTQTGTNRIKKSRNSAETQTIGNYVAKKSSKRCKTSTRTQTKKIESRTKSCNTMNELNCADQRNSCSTQTITSIASDPLPHNNLMCNDFMQSTSEDNLELFDTSFLNCTIETQTDLMLEENLLSNMSSDFSSNMYTQTCDDLLLTELGLNDIQTQTAQDEEDLLRTTETQTMTFNATYNCRDISHMETQTDAHFKQMLEEINA